MKRILLLLVLLLFLGGCGPAENPSPFSAARLQGAYTYLPGDDPQWALSHPDEPDAKQIKFHAWHILVFVPEKPLKTQQPTLLLEDAGCAHEVFLNGVKIGAKGAFGNGYVDAPFGGGIYRVPDGLLRPDRENRLAVRAWHARNLSAAPEPSVYLGDWRDLFLDFNRQADFRKAFEIVIICLTAIFLFGAAALYAAGMRGPEYTSFMVMILIYLVIVVLDSWLLFDMGLKNWVVQRLMLALIFLFLAAVIRFVFAMTQEPLGRQVKALMLYFSLFAMAVLFARPQDWAVLEPLGNLGLAWVVVLVLYKAFKAWKGRRNESLSLLVGIGGLILALLLDAAGALEGTGLSFFQLLDLGFAFFLASLGYGLLARYVRLQKKNRFLSQNIMKAHQDERMRFSRDIHDGLGQSLAALKLKLKMAAARKGNNDPEQAMKGIIPEVEQISRDLKDMARKLRPDFVDQWPVDRLLERLRDRFEEQSGIPADLVTDCPGLDLPVDIKDNLFRLCQEALNNISKHSGADRVEIFAGVHGKKLKITITDNGAGFDPDRVQKQSQGLGFTSMEERAQLMGGFFRLESAPGKGCRVTLEAPLT